MTLALIKLKTALRLGLKNILVVVWYRVRIRFGVHLGCKISAKVPSGPFFSASSGSSLELPSVSNWVDSANLFSHLEIPLYGRPPKWTVSPLTGGASALPLKPWWQIQDFDQNTGDIKLIWEMSRMDWVVAFAQRAREGDQKYLVKLNEWIQDWINSNPPYLGPNWKCGQEASIRIINLCCGALILDQTSSSLEGLQKLITLHLVRIAATLPYAIAQDNNHGTSEAAALFIGGAWLDATGFSGGEEYQNLGRVWLENRVSKLIQKDGSFSQYSLNYHRMVLDTLSIVEIWRRKLNIDALSNRCYESASNATSWLYQMISPETGDGPNLGANDGSLLLPLTDCPYRDFRPSVQLAAALFQYREAYPSSLFLEVHLSWLGVCYERSEPEVYRDCNFDSGGYKILRSPDAKVVFRYPNFKFRPSQADAMHIDFWVNGENVFGDAGSYSYNSIPDVSAYFSGTASHNTVEFDDRDQMPRLGRFLFGSWLKSRHISPVSYRNGIKSCFASYIDNEGAEHGRGIDLIGSNLTVTDTVKGFKNKAIIRWRLQDSEWVRRDIENGVELSNETFTLSVSSSTPIVRVDIVQGWKSLYYMKKDPIPVLEVEISGSGIVTTEARMR